MGSKACIDLQVPSADETVDVGITRTLMFQIKNCGDVRGNFFYRILKNGVACDDRFNEDLDPSQSSLSLYCSVVMTATPVTVTFVAGHAEGGVWIEDCKEVIVLTPTVEVEYCSQNVHVKTSDGSVVRAKIDWGDGSSEYGDTPVTFTHRYEEGKTSMLTLTASATGYTSVSGTFIPCIGELIMMLGKEEEMVETVQVDFERWEGDNAYIGYFVDGFALGVKYYAQAVKWHPDGGCNVVGNWGFTYDPRYKARTGYVPSDKIDGGDITLTIAIISEYDVIWGRDACWGGDYNPDMIIAQADVYIPPKTTTCIQPFKVIDKVTKNPIPGAEVTIPSGDYPECTAGADGRCSISSVYLIRGGTYRGLADAPDYFAGGVDFTGCTTEEVIELEHHPVDADGTFRIRVRDKDTEALLQGANVCVAGLGCKTTDSDGLTAFFSCPLGTWITLTITMAGYETLTSAGWSLNEMFDGQAITYHIEAMPDFSLLCWAFTGALTANYETENVEIKASVQKGITCLLGYQANVVAPITVKNLTAGTSHVFYTDDAGVLLCDFPFSDCVDATNSFRLESGAVISGAKNISLELDDNGNGVDFSLICWAAIGGLKANYDTNVVEIKASVQKGLSCLVGYQTNIVAAITVKNVTTGINHVFSTDATGELICDFPLADCIHGVNAFKLESGGIISGDKTISLELAPPGTLHIESYYPKETENGTYGVGFTDLTIIATAKNNTYSHAFVFFRLTRKGGAVILDEEPDSHALPPFYIGSGSTQDVELGVPSLQESIVVLKDEILKIELWKATFNWGDRTLVDTAEITVGGGKEEESFIEMIINFLISLGLTESQAKVGAIVVLGIAALMILSMVRGR